jgi:hypothetical protein
MEQTKFSLEMACQCIEERQLLQKDACWIWTGRVHPDSGVPIVWMPRDPRARNVAAGNIPVRKLMWLVFHGLPIPRGRRVIAACGEAQCVKPNHLKAVPYGGKPVRGTNARVAPEEITAIRMEWLMGESPREIAERHQLGKTTVYRFIAVPDPTSSFHRHDPWPLPSYIEQDPAWPVRDLDGNLLPSRAKRQLRVDEFD